jgi:hypothetical protein
VAGEGSDTTTSTAMVPRPRRALRSRTA